MKTYFINNNKVTISGNVNRIRLQQFVEHTNFFDEDTIKEVIKMKYKLLKQKMLDNNRSDFGKYLSEILGISEAAASKRLSGETKFTLDDINLIAKELNLSPDEIHEIFMEVDNEKVPN